MTALRKVVVCVNHRANPEQPSCGSRGSEAIACALEEALGERIQAIPVERFNCLGHCDSGPNVRLSPGGPFYHRVNLQDIPALMADIEKFYKA